MDPVIKSLIVKRFRSIPSEKVDFDNPTFLVGQNGSGKSNFVDIFAFLAEAMVSPLSAVFDRRGGIGVVRHRTPGVGYPPNLGLSVVFGAVGRKVRAARYAFEVRALPRNAFAVVREQCLTDWRDGESHWFDRTNGGFRTSLEGVKLSVAPDSLALPVIGGDSRFAPVLRSLAGLRTYAIRPESLREAQDTFAGAALLRDGSNAARVLHAIGERSRAEMERIGEFLACVAPAATRVGTVREGDKLALEFVQEWGRGKRVKFNASCMSDGTLRAVGLLAAVYQRPAPSVLVIEEPETTIHPGALGAILDLLRHASRKTQVVVTTHSPEVLDAEWIEDKHLRVVDWQEGATRIAPVSDASRQALREHLMGAGELLRSNALYADWPPQTAAQPREPGLFESLR